MRLIQLTSAPGFRFYASNSITACGRPSCSSEECQAQVYFSPPSKGYNELCGKMTGFNVGLQMLLHTKQDMQLIVIMLMVL